MGEAPAGEAWAAGWGGRTACVLRDVSATHGGKHGGRHGEARRGGCPESEPGVAQEEEEEKEEEPARARASEGKRGPETAALAESCVLSCAPTCDLRRARARDKTTVDCRRGKNDCVIINKLVRKILPNY